MSVIERVSLHGVCCYSKSTDNVKAILVSHVYESISVVCGRGGVLPQLSTCANG